MECRVGNGKYSAETTAVLNNTVGSFRTETAYTNKSGRTLYMYTNTGVILPIMSECKGNTGGLDIRRMYTFSTGVINELIEYFKSVNPAMNSELGALKVAFECMIGRLGDRICSAPEVRIVINFTIRLDVLFEGNYLYVPDLCAGFSLSSKATNISVNTPFDYQPSNDEIDRTIVNHKELNLDVRFIDNNDEKGSVFFTIFGKLWNIRGIKDITLKNGLYYSLADTDGLIVKDGKTYTRDPIFIPMEELSNSGIYSNREAASEFKLVQNEEAIRQSILKQMDFESKEKEMAFKEKERLWEAEMKRIDREFKEKERAWEAEMKRADREFKEQEYVFKEKERLWNENVREQERRFKDREYEFKDTSIRKEARIAWLKSFGQVAKEVATVAAVIFGAYKLYIEVKSHAAAV